MEFFTTNMAPIMFAGLILFLLMGFPVTFSLGACGLFFGVGQLQDGIHRPAEFECADFLKVLAFEEHLGAQQAVCGGGSQHGRAVGMAQEPP